MLKLLVNDLPEDDHTRPPEGRRVHVSVDLNEVITQRIYDRARLLKRILEIIHLTGTRVDVPDTQK